MKKNYITTLNDRIIQDAMSAEELMVVKGGSETNLYYCPKNDRCPILIHVGCQIDQNCINLTDCSCKDKRCTSPNEVCPITDIHSVGSCEK